MGYRFLTLGTISTAGDPRYMKIGASSKVVDLVISEIGRASCRERVFRAV